MRPVDGVHIIDLGQVNAYVLDTEHGRVLVDTGFEETYEELAKRLAELGPPDLIVLTHVHRDHTGGLAQLKRAAGTPAAMHPVDAELLRKGVGGRPVEGAPGTDPDFVAMLNKGVTVPASEIEIELADGDEVPGFPGLRVFHAPGHCAGQVVLLWERGGGLLVAGDAASNREDLTVPRVAEDYDLTERTLARLAELDFEAAVFGHGAPIEQGAARAFTERWAAKAV
jgi:glyoxylase-like metal-dependent hydrolase (beta-lactamase superfamily II)